MGRKRRIHDLGAFHRDATAQGLTYAEAQIRETCEKIGEIRVPRGEDAPAYMKVSTRHMLRKIAK